MQRQRAGAAEQPANGRERPTASDGQARHAGNGRGSAGAMHRPAVQANGARGHANDTGAIVPCYRDELVDLYHADSTDLGFLAAESIQLVVTSPPYNLGK